MALEELDRGWQGVFHRMILQQLPVEIMEEKFNKNTGRPTKELYSVCGLLLIMNYFGWTLSQARLNYMCRRARKMAGKQACKMAGKRAFHIKDKDVLSAAPVRAPRFERSSQSVLF